MLEENAMQDELIYNEDVLYEHFKINVDAKQEAVRIDRFLADKLQYSSRTRIQKAAEAGCIFVNSNMVKSNYKVKGNDVITIMLDKPKHETSIEAEDIPLNITYEDDYLMVINKDAGMVVHPGCGNFTGTLVNAVAWHLRNNKNYNPNDPEVGLVHRIDKDTSGLLVVAKTPEAKTNLGMQFFNKTTKRKYISLVWGNLDEDSGTIRGNITRDSKDRLRMMVVDEGSDVGKHAVTHYNIIERYGYTTLVECVLETGRTHQIRAHMKHIGHPLFADEKYGGMQILRGNTSSAYQAFVNNCFKICHRQALHAKTLGFQHPITKEEMNFSAPIPEDFNTIISKWQILTQANKK